MRRHLKADVNPLAYDRKYHGDLVPSNYGLSIWDLDRKFVTGGLGNEDDLPLRQILDILRITYTRQVGIEFMHISDPDEKIWLQSRIEPLGVERPITDDKKRRMLEKLNAAETGVQEVVMGMARRDRLNVPANILNKPKTWTGRNRKPSERRTIRLRRWNMSTP